MPRSDRRPLDAEAQGVAFASYADFYQASEYSRFPHRVRTGGSYGLQVMKVDQGPHQLADRATPDLLIGMRRKIEPRPARYHLGDRWINIDTRRPLTVVAPPRTDVQYDIGGSSQLIILAVPLDRLPDIPETDDISEKLSEVYETPFDDPLLTDLAERLWKEAGCQESACSLVMDTVVMVTLSILLSRSRCAGHPKKDREDFTQDRIARVLDYIEDHLGDDIRLGELASVACLSPFHFSRMFKAAVGVSPLRYVAERRVRLACRLLADPRSSALTVGLQCGFADSAHFATTFRKFMGLSPTAWRQENRIQA
jgi:AraC family transcriptional regulator